MITRCSNTASRHPGGLRLVRLLLGLLLVLSPAPLAAQIDITPDGGSASANELTSGNSVRFWIDNYGSEAVTVHLSCYTGGSVSSCSVQGTKSVGAGSSASVTVTYATGVAGSGTVELRGSAEGSRTGMDDGYYNITVNPAAGPPSVTPDGGIASAQDNIDGNTLTFTVSNPGSLTGNYTLSCSYYGNINSCSIPNPVSVAGKSSASVTVSYATGSIGSGSVALRATGGGGEDQGNYNITINGTPGAPSVTPESGSAAAPVNTTGNSVAFTVSNPGTASATYTLSCSRTGSVSSCVPPTSVTVGAGASSSVNVSYATGSAGTGTVTLTASYGGSSDSGSYNVNVATTNAPSVSTAPHNGDHVDRSKCAAGCFDAVVSYSTPAYYSMDTPRSATLVYASAQARPRGLVQVDAYDLGSSPRPTKMSLRLQQANGAWVTFTTGTQEIFYSYGSGDTIRLAGQFDASSLATGAYEYSVVVRSWWADGTMRESPPIPVRVIVVNESSSSFGAGWSFAGLQSLEFLDGGRVLVTGGDGTASLFESTGCDGEFCTYRSPAGDFSTLTLLQRLDCPPGSEEDGCYNYVPTHYERSYVDGTVVYFTLSGQDSMIVDRFGNTTRYSYDASGRLSAITDPAGKQIRLFYDANGKLDYIDDPAGRRVDVTVNAAGDLTHIYDPDGAYALQASYDASHRMTRRTDRGGGQWAFAYDFAGKLAADTMPMITVDGQSVRPVVQLSSLEKAVLVDPAAATGKGTSSDPASPRIGASLRAQVMNPRGFTTTLALDRFGAATRVEEPLGRITQVLRNSQSQDTLTIAPSGHRVRKTWSGPNLTQVYDSTTGRAINIEYESAYNDVKRIWGHTVEIRNFWSAGRLDSTRVGGSTATKYTYDSRGRILSVSDPENHRMYRYYDGNPWMNTDSVIDGGRRTRYWYDGFGRDTMIRDPMNEVARVRYDVLNRVIQTVGPLADTTTYFHGALALDSIMDAEGQRYRFYTNALGWSDSIADPRGRRDVFSRDGNGNVLHWRNRRGQTVSYTYDELDALRTRTADGVTTSYYTDPLGAYMAVSNPESTDTLRFDVAGRLVAEITYRNGRRYELASAYSDPLGTRASLTYNPAGRLGRVTGFKYNAAMQLDSLQEMVAVARWTGIGYNAERQADQHTLGSGLRIDRSFPSTHRTGWIGYSNTAVGAAFGLSVQYDGASRVFERANAAGDSVRQFSYNAAGWLRSYADYRVPSESVSCYGDENNGIVCDPTYRALLYQSPSHTYDRVGNRTDLGAAIETGNRLSAFDGYTLAYDSAGNLVHKFKSGVIDQRLFWNSLGQLDSVSTNGSTVAFGYDGLGRRVRKTSGSGTTYYIYEGEDLYEETDALGNVLAQYLYYPGTDRPHSMRRGESGPVYYYMTDHPGNVVGLVEGTSVVQSYRYSPWGVIEDSAGSVPNTLRFAARQFDAETGLYYNRARYYDPELGRFISEDPIGLAGGINPYVYAGNNPVSYTDPFGLCPEDAEAIDEMPCFDLDPIESAPWPFSTPRESGFSKNFGNRGNGTPGGGGSPGGGGLGGGYAYAKTGIRIPTQPRPSSASPQCWADRAGFALAAAGTASFAWAGARTTAALFRAYGNGLVARGLAPHAAAYGMQGAVAESIAASQAQVTLAARGKSRAAGDGDCAGPAVE